MAAMRFALLAASLAAGLCAGPAVAAGVPEPGDYRHDDYRAPVPDSLAGARTLETEAVAAIWKGGEAVFIDVLPKPPKPDLPKGTIFRLPPRDDIPGSIWLPDIGYGTLSPEMTAYFRDNLDKAVGGDKAKTVVFYCLADCWMSWNAARRAVEWGYRDVVWYPEGTDGWAFEDLPLERVKPVERPGIAE